MVEVGISSPCNSPLLYFPHQGPNQVRNCTYPQSFFFGIIGPIDLLCLWQFPTMGQSSGGDDGQLTEAKQAAILF